jgi:hypothetical protein
LRLLLDAHISPTVAREVSRHRPDCQILALRDWRGGRYLDERDDGQILSEAFNDGLTLLTRDVSTIGPLTAGWSMEGRTHAGVIFVDARTIAEQDVGGLIRAVLRLWDQEREGDWENRTWFLRRSQ